MPRHDVSTSLIICTYSLDRWDHLLRAVASARNLRPSPDEIIVVVDNNPELKARLDKGFCDLLIIDNREARGLSGARNSGIAASRGSLIAFLDDDAILDPSWLAYIKAHCEQNDVLGAMGRIEPLWLGEQPRWFPDEFLWVVGCTYLGFPEGMGAVRNLLGCAMCLRREVLEKVGGFSARLGRTNKAFPWSCEETELCLRAKDAFTSCRFVFEPKALAWHKIPAKRLTPTYFWTRCYAEGLSKWYVSALSGSRDALSAERSYVWGALSRGFARGFGDAILRSDAAGLGRGFAIASGVGCAVAGLAAGKIGSLVGELR